MNLFHAVILGIVEGVTEFLPVSSTGHMILASKVMGLKQTEFLKSFEIVIQTGAILSVIVLYWKQLFVNKESIKRIIAGFIPTALLGLVLYTVVKKFLLGNQVVVVIALAIGGIFIILFEKLYKPSGKGLEGIENIPYIKCAVIGLFQAMAFIPGVSRSAATILGGLGLGVNRSIIVEFSFLLSVPTMVAATGLDLMKTGFSFSSTEIMLLAAGFITTFFVAILSIKFLIKFIQKHNFTSFGIYRIVIAVLFWAVFIKN